MLHCSSHQLLGYTPHAFSIAVILNYFHALLIFHMDLVFSLQYLTVRRVCVHRSASSSNTSLLPLESASGGDGVLIRGNADLIHHNPLPLNRLCRKIFLAVCRQVEADDEAPERQRTNRRTKGKNAAGVSTGGMKTADVAVDLFRWLCMRTPEMGFARCLVATR